MGKVSMLLLLGPLGYGLGSTPLFYLNLSWLLPGISRSSHCISKLLDFTPSCLGTRL